MAVFSDPPRLRLVRVRVCETMKQRSREVLRVVHGRASDKHWSVDVSLPLQFVAVAKSVVGAWVDVGNSSPVAYLSAQP